MDDIEIRAEALEQAARYMGDLVRSYSRVKPMVPNPAAISQIAEMFFDYLKYGLDPQLVDRMTTWVIDFDMDWNNQIAENKLS